MSANIIPFATPKPRQNPPPRYILIPYREFEMYFELMGAGISGIGKPFLNDDVVYVVDTIRRSMETHWGRG